MNLILTEPILDDYKSYHELISEPDLQKQFVNYQGQTIEKTKKEIEFWVYNKKEAFPSFLRMIKLAPSSGIKLWNNCNSKLIGFISNIPASPSDHIHSGFKMLMNYGISKKFEGKGIMTIAMEMTLAKLYDLEYNIVSAYVKPGNTGSQRVLEKCYFDLIRDDIYGKTYVRALKIDIEEYKKAFNLK